MTFSSEIALCSNVDGNLTALMAVLKDIRSKKINDVYVIGGMCGIGARNNECLDVIRKEPGIRCMLGKWDRFHAGEAGLGTSDPDIEWFIKWSKDKISEENVAWLKSLPSSIEHGKWAAIPGRFDEGAESQFIERVADARKSFDGLYTRKKKLGFIGVTGVSVAFFDQNPITFSQDVVYNIDDTVGTLVNVGSVGGPKDDNPTSRYVIFDGARVTHVPVKYDVEQEVAIMNRLGFPKSLQEKLRQGK